MLMKWRTSPEQIRRYRIRLYRVKVLVLGQSCMVMVTRCSI